MKHKSVELSLNFNVKLPLHKRQAPLLTTFWRRFCAAVRLDDKIWRLGSSLFSGAASP